MFYATLYAAVSYTLWDRGQEHYVFVYTLGFIAILAWFYVPQSNLYRMATLCLGFQCAVSVCKRMTMHHSCSCCNVINVTPIPPGTHPGECVVCTESTSNGVQCAQCKGITCQQCRLHMIFAQQQPHPLACPLCRHAPSTATPLEISFIVAMHSHPELPIESLIPMASVSPLADDCSSKPVAIHLIHS